MQKLKALCGLLLSLCLAGPGRAPAGLNAADDAKAPTLEKAFAGGGLHLITVPIDYSENSRVLIEDLRGDSFLTAPRQT